MTVVLGAGMLVTSVVHAESASELTQIAVKPEPGVGVARPQPPPWCATVKVEGSWSPGGVRRTIEAAGDDYRNVIKGAGLLCQWARDPAAAHATGQVLQLWMNYTGMTQAQAAEAIGARVDADRFAADRKALCSALQPTGSSDEEKQFADARSKLFACTDQTPLWIGGGGYADSNDDVVAYLDASVTDPGPFVRMAHLLSRSRYVFGSYDDKALLGYITDQVDHAAISTEALAKGLDAAPYKGNTYARALALESHGRVVLAIARIKAAVDAKAGKDPAWRELLIAGPQRGIAEWNKLLAQHKDAIERSTAFEQKFSTGSRSAAAGCWPALRKDFIDVLKPLPHGTEQELSRSLGHPIAGLLFSRLAQCATVDTDAAYAAKLTAVSARVTRGPRAAAHYGAIDALNAIREDKPGFTFNDRDLFLFKPRNASPFLDISRSKLDVMGWVGDGGEGVVKAVTRSGDHAVISFQSDKARVPTFECVTTNRIVMFANDGRPIYDRNCRQTGTTIIDRKPDDAKFPVAWIDNIRPGTVLKFEATRGKAPDRWGVPLTVFSDASRKTIVNWHGFGI
ncbi:MAG: hypothetical protein KF773_31985 [Deltaproteobacteria bacterium]|nr:hypothetical protein [Deltaproteobacteria bacterium]